MSDDLNMVLLPGGKLYWSSYGGDELSDIAEALGLSPPAQGTEWLYAYVQHLDMHTFGPLFASDKGLPEWYVKDRAIYRHKTAQLVKAERLRRRLNLCRLALEDLMCTIDGDIRARSTKYHVTPA